MPPRLVRVGGYIRNSTSNARRRNNLTAFSFHPEDPRRNRPLANPLDRNLKFNLSEKRKRPAEEKKVPDDEWELRVGALIFLIDLVRPTGRSYFSRSRYRRVSGYFAQLLRAWPRDKSIVRSSLNTRRFYLFQNDRAVLCASGCVALAFTSDLKDSR